MNMPLGVIKETAFLRDDEPPLAIDLDKEVVIKLSRVTYHILTQYGQSRWKDLLTELRARYTWSEIQAAVMRRVELAELGLIFTDGNLPDHPRPHVVVAPGLIRNRFARSVMSNVTCYALLNHLSQHIDLSIFVPLDVSASVLDELRERCGGLKHLRYEPVLSSAAVAFLPLECDAILMFTPLHPEDLQFLTNRQCPLLLLVSSYGDRGTFNTISPVYSSLWETDVWVYPQFGIESQVRRDFPNLQHLYPLPLGVEPPIVEALPTKAELKRSLSQAFENDAFNSTPAIGVFGTESDRLTEVLATAGADRLYVCIAGDKKTADRYYTFVVDDIQEANALPHLLKGLDVLIFIAQGATEPYLLYLASAVGTPVLVVGCEKLPNDPFFAHVHHCPALDSQKILTCVQNVLKDAPNNNSVDRHLVSWGETSHQLLQLYRQANSTAQHPMLRVPRAPTHVFTKSYDPAQKRLTARAISVGTLESVPLEIGFVREMLHRHTPEEVSLILSHLVGSALTLDSGFDSIENKNVISSAGRGPVIYPNRRNTKTPIVIARKFRWFDRGLYKERYKVERTFGWQDTYRRLVVSYDRKKEIRMGWRNLAYAMVNFRVTFNTT